MFDSEAFRRGRIVAEEIARLRKLLVALRKYNATKEYLRLIASDRVKEALGRKESDV